MNELIISIPLLVLTIFLLYKINPRHCSRCDHGTYFGIIQHLQNNPNYPLQIYCLKCYLYINLSEWKCDKCHSSGTNRVHKINFISRLLVIKGLKIVPKRCQCGNIVELTKYG